MPWTKSPPSPFFRQGVTRAKLSLSFYEPAWTRCLVVSHDACGTERTKQTNKTRHAAGRVLSPTSNDNETIIMMMMIMITTVLSPNESASKSVKGSMAEGFRATLSVACSSRVYHLYGDLTIISPTMISNKPLDFRKQPWISSLWQGILKHIKCSCCFLFSFFSVSLYFLLFIFLFFFVRTKYILVCTIIVKSPYESWSVHCFLSPRRSPWSAARDRLAPSTRGTGRRIYIYIYIYVYTYIICMYFFSLSLSVYIYIYM